MKEGADVVVITALPHERDAVLRHLPTYERIVTKNRVYHRSELRTDKDDTYSVVVLSLGSMGNVSSAVATTQAIDVWNPQVILLAGITGGIKKNIEGHLGDLVVAEQIVGYEPGKVKKGKTEQRFEVYRSTHELLVSAKEFVNTRWEDNIEIPSPGKEGRLPKVHFGISASGEKVIADSNFSAVLTGHWSKLLGIEMEGVGVALAAYEAEYPPAVLQVKSVSDWADAKKKDNWQEYAADVSATFLCSFLAWGPFEAFRNRSQPSKTQKFNWSGKHKIRLCQRLGDDWHDLSDYFNIPPHQKRKFPSGRECQAVWEWLQDRDKLEALKEALEFIDRDDLVNDVLNVDI